MAEKALHPETTTALSDASCDVIYIYVEETDSIDGKRDSEGT